MQELPQTYPIPDTTKAVLSPNQFPLFPGTSKTATQTISGTSRSSQIDTEALMEISKKSSHKMFRVRSKPDLSTTEIRERKSDLSGTNLHMSRSKSKLKEENYPIGAKKSGILRSLSLNRVKSKQNIDTRPTLEGKRSIMSTLSLRRNKSKAKIEDGGQSSLEEAKKMVEDTLSLARHISRKDLLGEVGKTSLGTNTEHTVMRSCDCDPAIRNAVVYFTRWDNLVVVLLCAVALGVILNSPLSFLFGRRTSR